MEATIDRPHQHLHRTSAPPHLNQTHPKSGALFLSQLWWLHCDTRTGRILLVTLHRHHIIPVPAAFSRQQRCRCSSISSKPRDLTSTNSRRSLFFHHEPTSAAESLAAFLPQSPEIPTGRTNKLNTRLLPCRSWLPILRRGEGETAAGESTTPSEDPPAPGAVPS